MSVVHQNDLKQQHKQLTSVSVGVGVSYEGPHLHQDSGDEEVTRNKDGEDLITCRDKRTCNGNSVERQNENIYAEPLSTFVSILPEAPKRKRVNLQTSV